MKLTIFIVFFSAVANLVYAEQPSLETNFQQAVYLEEVTGDLHAAITLYERIFDAETDKATAAQAGIRAAQCYEQLGNTEQSSALYATLKSRFGELASVKQALEEQKERAFFSYSKLLPVPWQDNEMLVFHSYSETRQHINVIGRSKQLSLAEDTPQWTTHTFIINTMAKGHNTYQYTTDADTNKLISFNTNAIGYKPIKNWIENGKIQFKNTISGQKYAFADENNAFFQADFWDVVRRLPLEKGFSTKLRVHAPGGVSFFEAILKVTDDNERISVAAGDFNAFKLELESYAEGVLVVKESMYYSNDDHRYPLKIISSGVSIELFSSNSQALIESTPYNIDGGRINLILPPKWFGIAVPKRLDESQHHMLVRLDGQSNALIGWKDHHDKDWASAKIEDEMKGSIKWGKGFHTNYVADEESVAYDVIKAYPSVRYQSRFKDAAITTLEDRTWFSERPRVYGITFYTSDEADDIVFKEHDDILSNVKKIK